jgi:hypothetical protein
MIRQQLAMMDFDFKIRYKKESELSTDFLSRSFIKVVAISALDVNWVYTQSKGRFLNLIKEHIEKKWIYKFPMPQCYLKAGRITNMAVLKNNVLWFKNDKDLLY